MTYESDCCGYPDIVHMYGDQTGFVFYVNITKKVTAVKFVYT
jgi:hypothetical protein